MLFHIGFDPNMFQIGGFQLSWHGFFTAVAVAVAAWLGVRRAKAQRLPEEQLWGLATWAVIGGIIGARLFHVLDHLSYFADHPLEVFAVWQGGIAVYGAFLGGIAGGYISARINKLPAWLLLDAAALAMLVGQMIGRLGCLSNGDAWGGPTNGNWGLVYEHPGAFLPLDLMGVPTHPYPLYEILAVLALMGAMWAGRKYLKITGSGFLVTAIGYAVIRFGLSFFHEETVLFMGLQEAHIIAIATGLVALGLLAYRLRTGTPAPAARPRPRVRSRAR